MKAAEAILVEDLAASDARHIGEKIDTLADPTASWIERQVSSVESIEESADAQLQELNAIYQDKLEEYNTIRMESAEVTKRESANLTERTRKVELLGAKLDYELDALESRIEEVEEGLGEYERNIIMLERRVRNLVQVDEQKSETSWFRWGVQLFNRRPQRP
jgi:chromosome segregation ATPase